LLVFSNQQGNFQALQTELKSQFAELVDLNAIPLCPQVIDTFGANNPFSVLLRPDNYIGFISTETSLTGLRVYLKKFVGTSSS